MSAFGIDLEVRVAGQKNYKSFIVRFLSFNGDMAEEMTTNLAYCGFYLVFGGLPNHIIQCAFCELTYPYKTGEPHEQNVYEYHWDKAPTCPRIVEIAIKATDTYRVYNILEVPWYDDMGITPFLERHFTTEEIESMGKGELLDKVMSVKEKGINKCKVCKKRNDRCVFLYRVAT